VPRDAMGVDRVRLRTLRMEKLARFAERTPRSRGLYERGRLLMPNRVPQAWMAGLYLETPIAVKSGIGAT
jgi:hypothetical protein